MKLTLSFKPFRVNIFSGKFLHVRGFGIRRDYIRSGELTNLEGQITFYIYKNMDSDNSFIPIRPISFIPVRWHRDLRPTKGT